MKVGPPDLEALVHDRQRGAIAIALDAAALLATLDGAGRADAAAALVSAHPAMAPLRHLARAAEPVAFAAALRQHLDEAAQAAAVHLRGRCVLTVSASGLVEDTLRRAHPRAVHCLRSEPGGEGAGLAERLGARLWDDTDLAEAAAHADIGVCGADAVGPEAFVNKVLTGAMARAIGTLMLSVPEKLLHADEFALCAAGAGPWFESVPLSQVCRP